MSETEHSAYASGAQGEKADSALQPGSNISTLANDSGFTANTGDLESTNNLSDLANAATARANLGLSDTPVEDYLVDDGIHTITSSAGVATPDAANGRSQKFPLTENVSPFNTPTNLADGQSMLIQVVQGASAYTFSPSGYTLMGSGVAADIAALASGEYAWLSISRYGTDYLISITTQA